jgi:hypothetical protein
MNLFTAKVDRLTFLVDRSTRIVSGSIDSFGGSIDILFIRIFFYLNLFNKLDPLLYF